MTPPTASVDGSSGDPSNTRTEFLCTCPLQHSFLMLATVSVSRCAECFGYSKKAQRSCILSCQLLQNRIKMYVGAGTCIACGAILSECGRLGLVTPDNPMSIEPPRFGIDESVFCFQSLEHVPIRFTCGSGRDHKVVWINGLGCDGINDGVTGLETAVKARGGELGVLCCKRVG